MRKTYKETLDLMNDFADGIIQLNKMSDSDLSNIIIALEKQTPMKPIDFMAQHHGDYCPRCRKRADEYIDDYCKECGQKLDWSK